MQPPTSQSKERQSPKKLRSGNCLSLFFYTFMFKVFRIGLKRPYTKEDFFEIDDYLKYRHNLNRLLPFYAKHKNKHSLLWIIFMWALPVAIIQYSLSLYGDLVGIAMPFILREVIFWLEAYVVAPDSARKSLSFISTISPI